MANSMQYMIKKFKTTARWPRVLSGILLGWLIFLIVTFILVILVSWVLSFFGLKVIFGTGAFLIEIAVVGVLALSAASIVGIRFYGWLQKKEITLAYLSLLILLALSLVFFPGRF
jgi:hypothetical protein